jgi:hypothetical protein
MGVMFQSVCPTLSGVLPVRVTLTPFTISVKLVKRTAVSHSLPQS